MSIHLGDKGLENLIIKPLTFERGGKLRVEPCCDNEVYAHGDLFMHYELVKDYSGAPSKSDGGLCGSVGEYRHVFRNESGVRDFLDYWHITVWEQIPEIMRDVVFYVQFREAQLLSLGVGGEHAHRMALDLLGGYLKRTRKNEYFKK
jgi:hypothetical protein